MRSPVGWVVLLCLFGEVRPAHAQEVHQDRSVEGGTALPESVERETVVTGTRLPRPSRDVPSSVTVLPRAELRRNPSLTLDAVVRSVPGVATFRRSSSLVADPTSQGLNLRGVGPSAVSRSAVLLDGVPLNDAFGGWVYWRSLPRLAVDRVEIAAGPGSALYGSSALGGVLQLVTEAPRRSRLEAELSAGSMGTVDAAARGAQAWGSGSLDVSGELLRTDGFRVVAPGQAGAIDGLASSTHGSLLTSATYRPSEPLMIRARAGLFVQEQKGGTRFTTAGVRSFDGSLSAEHKGQGRLFTALFGRASQLEQLRARVAPGRVSETLAASQNVPSRELGGSVVWAPPEVSALGRHRLAFGADARWTRGSSFEALTPQPPGVSLSPSLVRRDAVGVQFLGGVFAEEVYEPSRRVQLHAAVRADLWRNGSAHRVLEWTDGTTDAVAFPDSTRAQVNPRAGFLWRPVDPFAVRGTVGSAFRAPTLNELYRPFQVGTVLTAANEHLLPERSWGGDLGVEWTLLPGTTAKVTGSWNQLLDPITNVTLPAPLADGSQRRRQNLGDAVIQGAEVSLESRLSRAWTLLLGYALMDARVRSAPGVETLVGKRLPQAPLHRASASVAFEDPRWLTAVVQLRVVGPQFEDDQNTRELGGYPVIDVGLSRRLIWGTELFVSVENLLNRQYLVGRAGVDTLGQPLTFRAGLRLALSE